ncbi:hypothetical protein [Actinoplanes sp. NBRC 103695]|uniref:hypothetical protein n=1 Tax=Actinoplanes sp. NBRC 103695 TaxID=3032202 RepID=UPI0025535406|nr:hypothetical protein [Actinoplanes sp. NBRC 103695]
MGLFVVAAVVGGLLWLAGRPVHASAAPLFAHWRPHVGPGTVPAVLIALLVCRYGAELSRRLPWRRLCLAAYGTAVAWITALALIDGWDRGVAGRLTTRFEYLHEVPGVTDIPAMLRGFSDRILDFQPDSWTTHVAGHPPGTLLIFVALDRIGLSGGGWAAVTCILAGALVAVAVPHTVRQLGTDEAARAVVPFLVLFPGAVWIGVSADGLFAGITATGIALLAAGVRRRSPVRLAGAGLILGLGCYLSYGLILMTPIALAVLFLGRPLPRQSDQVAAGSDQIGAGSDQVAAGPDQIGAGPGQIDARPGQIGAASDEARAGHVPSAARARAAWTGPALAAAWATAGAAIVVAAFTVAGFDWLAGYHLVVERYYQGVASHRPYTYWIWANLAIVLAVAAGPAATVILRRAAATTRPRDLHRSAGPLPTPAGPLPTPAGPLLTSAGRLLTSAGPRLTSAGPLLTIAAAAAILAADLSGYSKAEVERIWLPFTVWLPAAAALLPADRRRAWLVVQAAVALLVNHLLLTTW